MRSRFFVTCGVAIGDDRVHECLEAPAAGGVVDQRAERRDQVEHIERKIRILRSRRNRRDSALLPHQHQERAASRRRVRAQHDLEMERAQRAVRVQRQRIERLDGPPQPGVPDVDRDHLAPEGVQRLGLEDDRVDDAQRSERHLRRGEDDVVAHRFRRDAGLRGEPVADVGGQRGMRRRHHEKCLIARDDEVHREGDRFTNAAMRQADVGGQDAMS